ncbi:MAG: TetR/AcrR family transcriptional regulator [Alteromonadaceae bacterium]|nr:TetR/AcrR family transcriptional regulator [Alteromonadaceae bacterium]
MKQSERKRIQILNAAELLFSRDGVQNTSMDLLAQQAEVSKRTIYNHFATKEELFFCVLEHMMAHVNQDEEYKFSADVSIDEQLIAIAYSEARLQTSTSLLKITRVTLTEMMNNPEFSQLVASNKVGCMRYLETFLTDAVSAGVLKIENPHFAAQQFIYQLKSFIFYPKLYNLTNAANGDIDFIVNETVAMFLARYNA